MILAKRKMRGFQGRNNFKCKVSIKKGQKQGLAMLITLVTVNTFLLDEVRLMMMLDKQLGTACDPKKRKI